LLFLGSRSVTQLLQVEKPDTYVLATNRTETVRDFVSMSCKAADIDLAWEGNGKNEIGIDQATGKTIIKINPKFYRPAEVELLIGNPEKAKIELGWKPNTTLEELCQMMVETDLRRNKQGFIF